MSLAIFKSVAQRKSLRAEGSFTALTHERHGTTLRHSQSLMALALRSISLAAAAALAAWGLANVRGSKSISAPPMSSNHQRVIFGAGCFWGVERAFAKIPGVMETRVGYSGGHTPNPTYEKVCAHGTGHAEVVEVEFDPAQVSFEELLGVFWKIHDPSPQHRLGPEDGSQYRSAIFCTTPGQEIAASHSAAKLDPLPNTEIAHAGAFYPAEEYHQRYYEKHGIAGCRLP
ncbi:MAG: peptide-methionine (S)-S-oxide reductase MsrA [Chthoniobacteraceae bacterium]